MLKRSLIWVLAFIAYLYMYLVFMTSLTVFIMPKNINNLRKKSFIFTIWHGRLLGVFFVKFFFKKMYLLVSNSSDANVVNDLCKIGGASVVRGSSKKDGVLALKKMVDMLKVEDSIFGITPDGPIGPRMRLSLGAVQLSKISKKPILVVGFSAKNALYLKNWDRFMVPMPFTKIYIYIEEVSFSMGENIEEYREKIETKMNKTMWKYDRLLGVEKIFPDIFDKKGNYYKKDE